MELLHDHYPDREKKKLNWGKKNGLGLARDQF